MLSALDSSSTEGTQNCMEHILRTFHLLSLPSWSCHCQMFLNCMSSCIWVQHSHYDILCISKCICRSTSGCQPSVVHLLWSAQIFSQREGSFRHLYEHRIALCPALILRDESLILSMSLSLSQVSVFRFYVITN